MEIFAIYNGEVSLYQNRLPNTDGQLYSTLNVIFDGNENLIEYNDLLKFILVEVDIVDIEKIHPIRTIKFTDSDAKGYHVILHKLVIKDNSKPHIVFKRLVGGKNVFNHSIEIESERLLNQAALNKFVDISRYSEVNCSSSRIPPMCKE